MGLPAAKDLDFDIDKYLNRFIPRPRLHLLPTPISRFLGYRAKPREEIGNVLVWCWAFVGAFCGVALIECVVKTSPAIQSHAPPLIIGSFGAAAILEYNTIESPLAQPRACILGHLLSALTGVITTKLFSLSASHFDSLRWLAGALSCGLASAIMGLTKTTHPPAGATALLAAVDPQVSELGWYLVPLVLLSSVLMLLSALVINNLQRQFPVFWWTPVGLGGMRSDVEMVVGGKEGREEEGGEEQQQQQQRHYIIISPTEILLPDTPSFYLAGEESGILEILRERLKEGLLSPPHPPPPPNTATAATSTAATSTAAAAAGTATTGTGTATTAATATDDDDDDDQHTISLSSGGSSVTRV